jgi:hypothetical protein
MSVAYHLQSSPYTPPIHTPTGESCNWLLRQSQGATCQQASTCRSISPPIALLNTHSTPTACCMLFCQHACYCACVVESQPGGKMMLVLR